jgi:DNA-directed RNA polymerase specialized sigma24 family protein
MQPLKQLESQAADLYWLAFLLTGNHQASLDAAVDAAELRQEANPFFSTWVLRWSRKIAISKALSAIRDELKTSAQRTQARPAESRVSVPRNWSLSSDVTKFQLEQALLAIDVLPRCALVLSILEGLPLEDVAILLDEDRELIQKARACALQELIHSLASGQPQTPMAISPAGLGELQHA